MARKFHIVITGLYFPSEKSKLLLMTETISENCPIAETVLMILSLVVQEFKNSSMQGALMA